MSHKKIIGVTGLMIIVMCLTACGHKKTDNPYGPAMADLGDEDAYAFLDMDYKNYVMVTSDGIYDAGIERQAAIYCTVYYYGKDEAINLGTVMSDGTAYPISFSRDGIFAASGHRIEKYAVSEKDNALYLKKGVYVEYDEDGNERYTSVTDGKEAESDEEEYRKLAEEYEESQAVHFSYGAAGCVNEIVKYSP